MFNTKVKFYLSAIVFVLLIFFGIMGLIHHRFLSAILDFIFAYFWFEIVKSLYKRVLQIYGRLF